MSYCIIGENGSLEQSLNIAGWQSLMGLAYVFGWEPQGTVLLFWKDNKTGEMFPPGCLDDKKCKDGQWVKNDSWSGSYCSNDCQEITTDDARNFAEALEKALGYISGNRTREMGVLEELDDGGWDGNFLVDRKNTIDAWSGLDAQERIRSFIDLFKSGACNIL